MCVCPPPAGYVCPAALPSGGSFSSVPANLAFKPAGPQSTLIRQVIMGATYGGAILGAIIIVLMLLEVKRWRTMKRAVTEELQRKERKKKNYRPPTADTAPTAITPDAK